MFCPRCGFLLEPDGATLRCAVGDMQLSPRMLARLDSYREAGLLTALADAGNKPIHRDTSRWFCPACGAATELVDGYLRCSEGGGVLNDYVFELVELHPHRRPNGRI